MSFLLADGALRSREVPLRLARGHKLPEWPLFELLLVVARLRKLPGVGQLPPSLGPSLNRTYRDGTRKLTCKIATLRPQVSAPLRCPEGSSVHEQRPEARLQVRVPTSWLQSFCRDHFRLLDSHVGAAAHVQRCLRPTAPDTKGGNHVATELSYP